jgi:4-amino-4-deoxy-L-arabinose transferase-like glycosyltransferase
VAYLLVLLATAGDVGFSRDEGFYFTAARDYQAWFDVLAEDPQSATEKSVIGKHWRYNHEHPALMKVLFGFSNRLFNKKWEVLSPATSFRLPGMLAALLVVYLIYLWGSSIFGRVAGIYAALAFALMPRVFYHAHLACFDVAITAAWLLVSYLYWRSLSSWKFGLAAAVAFGFALCVKLNAFFIPLVLGFHYLSLLFYRRLSAKHDTGQRLRAPKPWAFVFGLVIAPAIFIAHWPWLWHDTLPRLLRYMGFHSNHPFYNTAWFGENIIQAPTPIALPIGLTAFTIPTVVIALAIGGIILRLRHHLPPRLGRRVQSLWTTHGPVSRDGLDFLLLLSVIFSIALISHPSVPIFGGTKHWMPAFPFIAIFAGLALSRVTELACAVFSRVPAKLVQVVTVVVLLLPPLQQTVTSHPFGLASYVPLIGGAPGAATLGMTRQFWGYTTTGVIPWLNEHVPKKGGVFFHDTAYPSVRMFQEQGILRPDIRVTRIKSSTAALLHHELHMIVDESWIWNAYRTVTPAHVLTYQGVPIVSVYKRPARKK